MKVNALNAWVSIKNEKMFLQSIFEKSVHLTLIARKTSQGNQR